MSSLTIIVGAAAFLFFVGYRLYGRLIERALVAPNGAAQTPATARRDGVDYEPTHPGVLFGHQFASIAGAGPIIGPIIAVVNFGWAASLGWILIGSVFIGAVHDYLALMVSVRHGGASIADVARTVMNRRAMIVFSIFLYTALVLVVAVFGVVGAKTLVQTPEMVVPTFGIIPVAMGVGVCLYRWRLPLVVVTLVGLAITGGLILLGQEYPLAVSGEVLGLTPLHFWFVALMGYAALASLMPVTLLLQPRDYLSSYLLYAALGLGILAVLLVRPEMHVPAVSTMVSDGQGPLWPMLFVVIACGAVSGFHSLVSGGTTSKQLANERDGLVIGYGAMLTEGLLATLTLVLVGAGLYWVAPAGLAPEDVERFVFPVVYQAGGPIVAFGNGFGRLVSECLPIPFALAAVLAMITLNTFVLTTLDTATRITRFIVQEGFGPSLPVLQRPTLALALVIVPATALGMTNAWSAIWPVFGATNQLIAALALFVVTDYLITVKRPTGFTLYPAYFMLVTTIAALAYLASRFLADGKLFLATLAVMLIVLALYIGWEGLRGLRREGGEGAMAGEVEAA
jgi:carbon starvation protein